MISTSKGLISEYIIEKYSLHLRYSAQKKAGTRVRRSATSEEV